MPRELLLGRWLAGTAFAAIGLGAVISGHLPLGLVPLKTPLPPVIAGLIGTLFASLVLLATASPRFARMAQLAALFPLSALLLIHLPGLVATVRDPLLWSSLFQMLAIIGGILFLSVNPAEPEGADQRHLRRLSLGVWGASLIGFGVQHFMYPAFIAGLIPEWMPARTALAWITGIAFVAAALSFLVRRFDLVAGRLLALMWISWVPILHLPRIAAEPGLEAGWTSGLIALGLGGAALLVARRRDEVPAAFRVVYGGNQIAA